MPRLLIIIFGLLLALLTIAAAITGVRSLQVDYTTGVLVGHGINFFRNNSNDVNQVVNTNGMAGKVDVINGSVNNLTNTGNTVLTGTNFSFAPNGSQSNKFSLSQAGIQLDYDANSSGWLKWTNDDLWLRTEKTGSDLYLDSKGTLRIAQSGSLLWSISGASLVPSSDNIRDFGNLNTRLRNIFNSGYVSGGYESSDVQAKTNALIAASAYGLATSKTNGGDLVLSAGMGSERFVFNDITQLTNTVFYVVANKAVYSTTNNGVVFPWPTTSGELIYSLKTNLNTKSSTLFQVETNASTNLYFLKQAACYSLIISNSVNTNGVDSFKGNEGSVRIVSQNNLASDTVVVTGGKVGINKTPNQGTDLDVNGSIYSPVIYSPQFSASSQAGFPRWLRDGAGWMLVPGNNTTMVPSNTVSAAGFKIGTSPGLTTNFVVGSTTFYFSGGILTNVSY